MEAGSLFLVEPGVFENYLMKPRVFRPRVAEGT